MGDEADRAELAQLWPMGGIPVLVDDDAGLHRWDERKLPDLTRYFDALLARPSVARVVDQARPYRAVFPLPWPDNVD